MQRPGRIISVALAALLAGVALVALAPAWAQPVVAEMKIKVYETWIELLYDVTPGTVGDTVVGAFDGANSRVTLAGDVRICDTVDGCPTAGVATANGELFVEGDLEADGNLNVAGTSTLTGAITATGGVTLSSGGTITQSADNVFTFTESEDFEITTSANLATFSSTTGATFAFTPAVEMTGDLTCSGGTGALTFSDSASSIVVPDNDTTALLIGSTGRLNLMTFDTGDNTETVVVAGTTATTAFHVDVGESLFDEGVDMPVAATHLERIRFCGNGPNGATAQFMGPVLLDDTEADLAFGGAGCDALDNATEATADNPWHAGFAFRPVAMACVGLCTGTSAANDAIVFQLRDDTASVTGMTCTTPALGGDGVPAQCVVRDASPATVAANSAVAVSITMTDDVCNDAGDDFECLVYVTF